METCLRWERSEGFVKLCVLLAPVKWRKSNQRVNVALRFLPIAILVRLSPQVFSDEHTAHLFIEQRDIKSEDCLASHLKSKQNESVYAVIGMNRENCRQATLENEKTSVALVAEGRVTVRHLPGQSASHCCC